MPSEEQLKLFPWGKLSWLIVNEGEASDLYKVLASSSENELGTHRSSSTAPYAQLSAYPVLLRLSSQMPSTKLICTLGAVGVLALLPSASSHELIFLPAAKLRGDIRDTTGAGDCFTGYLVAGLMKFGSDLTIHDATSVLRRCVQVNRFCYL